MVHPVNLVWQSCPQWADPLGELLYDAVIELGAKQVLEIGTNIGDSTRILSAALRETGGKLWSLDKDDIRDNWIAKWDCSNIEFIRAGSQDYLWSRELDLLLIDGGHEYETALADLTHFSPWVRLGGKIFLHDTRLFPNVQKALTEWTARVLLPYTEYPDGVGLAMVKVTKSLPRT